MKSSLNVQFCKSNQMGRVTPCAPEFCIAGCGAHGVTRPTRRLTVGAICLFFFLLTSASPLLAQTPPVKNSSGRYLFIVDTSKAMRPRATAVQTTVNNLLLSGMQAQLQRGDTIGVWTYNEQLYAGRLPLQQWTPEGEQLVASNILAFLKEQSYEKTSRLETVWPALQSVVRESEKLTILLVSDGDERISGTPFDREINEFFTINSRPQKQKRMPFVIVLRSYRGKFISVTLNLAPWPAEFSPYPPEPKVTVALKPKPPPEKTAPPPLIVIGKKPEPASVAPTAPSEPTPTKSAVPTNDLPAVVVEPKSPPAPADRPAETAPTTPAATIQPKPDVSPIAATLASPAVIAPSTESSRVSAPTPVNPEPTAVAPPVRADELKPEPSPPPATVQVATATQPEPIFNRTKLLLTAGVLLVLGVAFFFLKQRRARAIAHVSLITRSMKQDKK